MWTYAQRTGELYHIGVCGGKGYSGAGSCKNEPDAQDQHNKGPIPRGDYHIGPAVDTLTHGPHVLPLTPDPGNVMFGRTAFLIHGDSVVHPGAASEGCIIMDREVRNMIAASDDKHLQVVENV